MIFGVYSVVDAVAAIAASLSHPTDELRDTAVLYAAVGIASGLFAALAPDVTPLGLALLIGARALAAGALELMAESRLRRHVTGEWLLGASGGMSLLFGFCLLLFLFRNAGAVGLLVWIGLWAVVLGGLRAAIAIELRTFAGRGFALKAQNAK